ncbi:MAG TPA: 3-phosphoshikimate 1-carboxyvinyltransferase [Burkholderiales bacterium]|nr:3-phosphoshikimate 1-carboxyvinyltransferase [Burkholderiales bacterium]
MRKSVHPSSIEGAVKAPPSKSVMQRFTAAALLAEGRTTRIRNPSVCDDSLAALRVAGELGAAIKATLGEVVIQGGLEPRSRELDCRESGLCLRLFTAVAALRPEELVLSGRGSLLRRSVEMVERPLRELGASCQTESGFPPVLVRGPLVGGTAFVDGSASSQFLSGLLMALPLAGRDSRLVVRNLMSRPYVDMTLQVLAACGVKVRNENYGEFIVPAGQAYAPGDLEVEGDWSAAAALLVAGAVGGKLRVHGLRPDSVQADRRVLTALGAAGARVRVLGDSAEVEKSDLRAFSFDATDAPDLLPPLVALACHCAGTSTLAGASRLRGKESDRAAALVEEFGRLGARIAVEGDVIEVRGGMLAAGEVHSAGDHRIAMALAAAALCARGTVAIDGAECVAKSYPGFFEDLASVGGKIDE